MSHGQLESLEIRLPVASRLKTIIPEVLGDVLRCPLKFRTPVAAPLQFIRSQIAQMLHESLTARGLGSTQHNRRQADHASKK